MSSFTVELDSNASFDCYPNKTLSSFTNFLPEQINLDGEWEVAITELSYPSLYPLNGTIHELSKFSKLTI